MAEEMCVSIVVPLFNKAKYVTRALTSIANQTCRDFEAIIVDDGSTDGGAELAAGFPDRRFRVVHQPNAGPGAARNRGIAEVSTEFVAFLDADDSWQPEYLEASIGALQQAGPEVAAFSSGWVDYPHKTTRERIWRKRGLADGLVRTRPLLPPLTFLEMVAYMHPCSTVARVDAVRRLGGFYSENSCRYGEDAILWLKMLLTEPVLLRIHPLANVHRDASELSRSDRGPRPIEPFLLDPADVCDVCPVELLPLLHQFLAIRACKTAAMLGYWGQWRAAHELMRRFASYRDWRLPFFAPAMVACTPLGGLLGRMHRTIAVRRPPREPGSGLRCVPDRDLVSSRDAGKK